jgi:hypothetical protein
MYVIGRCDTLDFLWQFDRINMNHEKMPSLSTWTLDDNDIYMNKIIDQKKALAYVQVFDKKNSSFKEIIEHDIYRNLDGSLNLKYSIFAREIHQLLSNGFKAYISNKIQPMETYIGLDGETMMVLEIIFIKS